MSLYQFISADEKSVLHTETRRCIYLDQPATIHTESYIKWRDGWTEVIPATETEPEKTIVHDPHVTDPYIPPPPPPPAPIPQEVTMRQARLALLQTGQLATVESAIASLPEPNKTAALIEWDYSNTVQRNNPFTASMIQMLGMTEQEADALFVLASGL